MIKKFNEFKINESKEVTKLEEFADDVKDVFAEIMDDKRLSEPARDINGNMIEDAYDTWGDPVFYIDNDTDQIFIKFDKPKNFESIYDLEDDLEVAFARLRDNYEFSHSVSDYSGMIKINIRLGWDLSNELPHGFRDEQGYE